MTSQLIEVIQSYAEFKTIDKSEILRQKICQSLQKLAQFFKILIKTITISINLWKFIQK